jgi:hypothetical protein
MKYLFSVLVLISLSGCVSYSQLFQTASPTLNKDPTTKRLTFENDTLKVEYFFWEDEGVLAFSITNKLEKKPIYIDWKKSSYVKNGNKLDYWVDEDLFNSITYSASLSGRSAIWSNLDVTISVAETRGRSVRPERITFIAPNSKISKLFFVLLDEKEMVLSKKSPVIELESQISKGKKFEARSVSFSKKSSPLVFRNFLTFSTSEKFETESYIDNEFYVSQITEMPTKELLGWREQMGWVDHPTNGSTSPFKAPDRFYMEISKGSAVKTR